MNHGFKKQNLENIIPQIKKSINILKEKWIKQKREIDVDMDLTCVTMVKKFHQISNKIQEMK